MRSIVLVSPYYTQCYGLNPLDYACVIGMPEDFDDVQKDKSEYKTILLELSKPMCRNAIACGNCRR